MFEYLGASTGVDYEEAVGMEESSVVVFFVILRGMVYWSGVSPRLLTRHIFRTILPTVVKCVHINGLTTVILRRRVTKIGVVLPLLRDM